MGSRGDVYGGRAALYRALWLGFRGLDKGLPGKERDCCITKGYCGTLEGFEGEGEGDTVKKKKERFKYPCTDILSCQITIPKEISGRSHLKYLSKIRKGDEMRSIVITGILIYALGFVSLFYVSYLTAILMLKYQPAMSLLIIVSGIGALILLGSAIGLYFKKRIAYYTAIISLTIVGISGIVKNIWIEVFTPSIWAGLGGMGPDIFWYIFVPMGMIAYLIYDLERVKKEVIK